ncbi:hypothetical protein PV04_10422 [Phialophora macrospora]|uniref:Uncharacterized protein n=1 Tax=Phialophora macrospora TaxID=1851006 RepID=A0A0D2DIN1_9EURO|nr:hypothetical protein PV04_10422 [Phialophora macrospora]
MFATKLCKHLYQSRIARPLLLQSAQANCHPRQPVRGLVTSRDSLPLLLRPGANQAQSLRSPALGFRIAPSIACHTRTIHTMSDDAAYMSFLDKANADPRSGQGSTMAESESTSQRRSSFDPTSSSSSDALPASLKSLPDITFTSDTDSPFEPVLFNFSGSELPSASEFSTVLSHAHMGKPGVEVEELNVGDFDPRDEYKEIIQRVEQAGKGETGVKVFRVQASSTRAVYYILTVGEKKLIGVATRAVES